MDRDQNCEFDVFLCHNSRDKAAVREIACELRARNIRPWLDEWELRPGLPWQRAIEQQLRTVPAAGVFVGPSGYGPWQEMEQEALLRQFVERRCPVIPVILRGVEQVPTLPLFLSGMTWVDFRRSEVDPIEQLVWGVTGRSPERVTIVKPRPSLGGALSLRQPIRDFTGRAAELKRLRQVVDDGATIIGIQGLGGVGKTELALCLVKDLDAEYADAQLMIDLEGTSAEPLPWPEAMNRILQTMLPDDRLPGEPEALAAAYRGQLMSRRGLLLLDNARDREQVERLIPPDSWLLLVTSRQHLTVPGMATHDLEVMLPSEARDMLLKISSRDVPQGTAAVDVILRLCGYLPLAIRLAGGALAERPDWSLDEYARRLKDRSERVKELDEVMASIGLSHELLSKEDRRRLAELSILATPFDADSATAIWDASRADADRILGRLLRHDLIEWDRTAKCYLLNNLVHDYAANNLDADSSLAAHVRHARYLVRLLAELNSQYLQGGENVVAALARFDAIWPLVRSEFVACQHSANEEAVRLVSETPHAAAQLFDLRRNPRERIEWRQAALAAARQLGDRRREGNHLGNLGLAHSALGEPRRAIEYLEQRIAIARELGDRHYEGRGFGNLGLAFAMLGQTQRAVDCQEQYLHIAREIGDRLGEGNALRNLGLAHAQLNETSRAIELQLQALAVSREIGDYRAEGEFLGDLGRAYSQNNDTRRAIECYEQALQIDRKIGNREGEAEHCWSLGRALDQLGETARAVQLIQASVEIAQELGHPDAVARADHLGALESRLAEPRPADRQATPIPSEPKSGDDSEASDQTGAVWVGRRDALDQLAAAFAAVRRGQGSTVFVFGRSGIGKTALAHRFIDQSCRPSNMVVLCGKCHESAHRPFKGFDTLIDSLASYLARLPRESVERVMPVDVGALCHIFPALSQVEVFDQASGSTATLDAFELRRRAFDALRALFSRMARFNGLVLFIDDLQWGGQDTADLFAHVFRAPDAPACLTICAARDENCDNEFFRSIRDFATEDQRALVWQELRLERLDEDEAGALAGLVLGQRSNETLTQRIAAQAQGHPLLVRLLAEHTLREHDRGQQVDEPARLEDAIMALVESLDQPRRQLVELLAVGGCALEEKVLAEAAGLQDEQDLFRELRSKMLVRSTAASDNRCIDLYHDKIRETILAGLSHDQRSAHSECLASALESAGGDPALLGELFSRLGQGDKAGEYFFRAARISHGSLAFHRASELYLLAIEQLQPTGDKEINCRRLLGDALNQAGRPVDAAQQYLLAAEAATNPDRLDLFCLGARGLLTSGHVEPGIATLKKVLAECGITFPDSSLAAIASLLWNRLLLRWRGYKLGCPQEDVPDNQLRRLQAYWAAVSGLSVIDPLRAADFAARGLLEALRSGERTHVIRALTAFSGHVAAGGYRNRHAVDELLASIDELAASDGRSYARAVAAIAHGVAAHLQSQYRTSIKYCDQAVADLLDDRSRATDPRCRTATWELNVARSMAMWSLMYLGRIDDLAQRQPDLLRTAEETNNLFAALNFSTQVMTHITLGADQPEEARRRLQADAERLARFGFFVQHQNHLLALAFVEQYCGRGAEAWRHLENARRRYTKSVLSRVQHMRIDFLQAKGRAALAAAAEADNPRAYLHEAESAAKQLLRQRTPWADAHAKLLRSALAAIANDPHAAEGFTEAAECFEASDGQLFAAAARIRAAQLTATGLEEAVERMSRLGVCNPKRMSAALIPG